ncbi:MAG: ABC transporter ATP-binding protein [Ruminococcus sp.]|jgi:iron complex transport system ATP-binding protein
MLTVNHLQFQYHGDTQVLKQISFTLDQGEFLAVLGNNGAGKSTMLKCFNGIIKPDRGEIFLDQENLLKMPAKEAAKRIAFVAQNVPNTQMTVYDMVMLGRRPYMRFGFSKRDHEIVGEVMEKLNIFDFRGRFLNRLSGGERQKVMLARALAQEPKLLLLDEPTSSLDLKNQYQVLQIVRDICHETGILAIVVIHDLNLALRFCDRFLLLHQGQVYRWGKDEIIDREALWKVYGIHGEISQAGGQKVVLVD